MFRAQDHEIVPKHEILTPKEKKEVLDTLGIDKEQLPIIKETDPVAKEITAKPGDVLRIVRKSQTAGKTVYYRLVTMG
jgi:DNA-directed RNA polymerase subunit H